MPPKRVSRRVSKLPDTITHVEDAAPDAITSTSSRRNLKRKAEDELDLLSVPDSQASPITTPARKRRGVTLGTPIATTSIASTRRSSISIDESAMDTPATSIDQETDLSSALRAKRTTRAARSKASVTKYESDSEADQLDFAVEIGSVADSTLSHPIDDDSQKKPRHSRKSAKSYAIKDASDSADSSFEPDEAVQSDAASLAADSDVELNDAVSERPAARRRRERAQGLPRLSQYEKTMAKLIIHHPELETVWGDLDQQKVIIPTKASQPEILTLKLLPFQLEGLHWLRTQEKSDFHGGILADEMGMGKTIQTVAMLVSDNSRGEGCAGTLVVAPSVAIMQWKQEIEKYTNNALSILIYHGSNRESSAVKIKNYDIVLTTYNLLESDYRKQQSGFKRKHGIVKERSLLHSIDFHRIVLDEAHMIKDRSCGTARAVFNLKTNLRWCLSGTPLQNRVGELFSMLRFLQADPFSYYYCKKCPCKSLHWKFSDKRTCDDCHHRPMDHTCWFNHELLKPIQRFGAEGEGRTAFKKIHTLLRRLMLRRTKIERADDMGLPPKVVKVRRDLFNDEEEDLYDSLYGDSKRKFNTYADQGTVLNNYANIFQLITRMRQMADHPDLILKRHTEEGQNQIVCRICDDVSEDAIKSKCHHVFCRVCVTDYADGFSGAAVECPVCHIPLNIDFTAPALETANEDLIKRNSILNRIDMSKWRSSSKIEALVEELSRLRSKDSSIKSIVFSQWTSFLELVNWRLRRAGFSCCKLDGSMQPEARAKTINHFSTDPSVSVFLVSLKAGGVALNLTEASQGMASQVIKIGILIS